MQLVFVAFWFSLLYGRLSIEAFAGIGRSVSKLKHRSTGSVFKQRRDAKQVKTVIPPITDDHSVAQVNSIERLQKIIAHSGVASRRTAEEMIQDGRVSVNGKLVTELGRKVNSRIDSILVDGKKVSLPDVKETFWVAVHKPKDMLTTLRDEKERSTVLSLVPKAHELHLLPVGGLDRDYTGLMVLTNDVGWIHHLTHPAYPHNNRYEVLVEGLPEETNLDILRSGVTLPGESLRCVPAPVEVVEYDRRSKRSILDILVDERRAMQLEHMLEHIGCKIVSMKRLEFCGVRLKGLKKGAWRELTPAEVASLKINCNPAAGLKRGYAAVAAAQSKTIEVSSRDIPIAPVTKRRFLAPNLSRPKSKNAISPPDSPATKEKRPPHRLKPRYRDGPTASLSLLDDDFDASERVPSTYSRRSTEGRPLFPSVHRKSSSTYASKRDKRTEVQGSLAQSGSTMGDGSPRRQVFAEKDFAPTVVRKNSYERSFRPTPSKRTAATRRTPAVRRVGRRDVNPSRPVYGAEPWMKPKPRERVSTIGASVSAATSRGKGGSEDNSKPKHKAKSNKYSKHNRKSKF